MQPARNPTRRNRNIGTARQGHGQNNSLVIPMRSDGQHWLDEIGSHQIVEATVNNIEVRFIVEKTITGCIHPCTIADVSRVLEQLPKTDWVGLRTIIFRQPTRKQLMLSPVWGRLVYFARPTSRSGKVLSEGPAIFLEATEIGRPIVWRTSLDPEDADELQRLREDGHLINRVGKKHVIEVSAYSARQTQLYRTLLHEMGHWFDWLSKVEEPAARGEDFATLEERYFARPKYEREAFAHRYAEQQRLTLEATGIIPFEPLP